MKDDYVERVGRGLSAISRAVDAATFEGIIRNRSEPVCRCHGKPIFIQPQDYYAGIPSCSVTRQALGPDGVETRPLPDLIFPWFRGERPENSEDWKP